MFSWKKLLVTLSLCLPMTLMAASETLKLDQLRMLDDEKNTISVFNDVVGSVVNVSNIRRITRGGGFFVWGDEMDVPQGQGSGFVWDEKGHIVTNFHVIQGGDSFIVSFHEDGKQYKAKLVGAEPKKDIAVLQLEEMPKTLKPVTMGESSKLLVGQKTMALGNPFGLDHTITSGIVSALDRKILGIGNVTINGMIQTDSSINPGNSGGPLLDSAGRVIGMNTMIYSQSGASAGVGFAVPADTIKSIVPQLIQHGRVIRPGLGIGILPEGQKRRFGVDNGIVITYVDEKGPAGKAGLRGITRDAYGRYFLGDIITKIDGKKVDSYDDIYHTLEAYKIGEKVTVEYIRDGKIKKETIKLSQI